MALTKESFKARVYEWAQKLDIEVKTISIRPMKNKWTSYTKKSQLLIFNTELLSMSKKNRRLRYRP